jgi:hypothetical protein
MGSAEATNLPYKPGLLDLKSIHLLLQGLDGQIAVNHLLRATLLDDL